MEAQGTYLRLFSLLVVGSRVTSGARQELTPGSAMRNVSRLVGPARRRSAIPRAGYMPKSGRSGEPKRLLQ